MDNSINFRAKFISGQQIKKFNYKKQQYSSIPVSFVEIDNSNIVEARNVNRAVKNWYDDTYGKDIVESLYLMVEKLMDRNKNRIYAVTLQKDNFDSLRGKDILGLAQINMDDEFVKKTYNNADGISLEFIQVNPDTMCKEGHKKYSGIGTCILNMLKNLYHRNILLNADVHAVGFYEENGFKKISDDSLDFIWTAK